MTFYSHSKKDDNGNIYGSKELKTHIYGVKEKALSHLANNVELGFSEKELKELIEIAANLHDLGKYTTYFQNYLLKKEPVNQKLKQHARIGAFTAFNLLAEEEKKARLVFYLIFLHHSSLIDFSELSAKLGRDVEDVITQQQEDLKSVSKRFEDELGISDLSKNIFYSKEREIRKGFRKWKIKEASIQDYFLINYLFSLLIEADKLDASDTKAYTLKPIQASSVDDRFGKPQLSLSKPLKELSNNELRNYCRAMVVSSLDEPNVLDHYIFTLTAPTGIGKTMTALDFSLKLKEKIKRETDIESRIIYGLPFINIIEQALDEYKTTLGNQDVKILGHYQYADIFGEDKSDKNEIGEETNYNQKLMALDTWQADIVITSFVQFFETLISNRNRMLKKFNHFANAIIILDEVQTLRLDQMPLLGAAIFYLSEFMKSRIILMTATRPKIFELAEQEILSKLGVQPKPKELLANYEEVFAVFNRTLIQPLLNIPLEEDEEKAIKFADNIFLEKWEDNKSCLIVCNSVKHSIDIYNAIQNSLEENGFDNPIYYLSTNIIPADRFSRIEDIRKDLKNGNSPILISTQVVEAGVDLDFDMGFRDIGPIDSIIQVAGRINRNNDKNRQKSPLYIIDYDSKMTIRVYGRLAYIQAKSALSGQDSFEENEYLQLIQGYFDGIADKSSFAEARKYFESMQTLHYDNEDKSQYPVSAFKIIEESNRYAPVFIESDEDATDLLMKYRQKIVNEISKEEFDSKWKLKFQQQIISVPRYLCDDLETVNEYEEEILLVSTSEIVNRYNYQTGYNRNHQDNNSAYVF